MSLEEIREAKASQIKNAKEMQELIRNMYKDRLKNGWTLTQIDEMDIHFYLSLINDNHTSSHKTYIDDIKLF